MPKGSELTETNILDSEDYIIVITNPDTNLIDTNKITKSNFFANVSRITTNTLIISSKTTPSNSTMTISRGNLFFDDDYLYVPTANNTIKRIALQAF